MNQATVGMFRTGYKLPFALDSAYTWMLRICDFVAALALSRLLTSLLYSVSPADPTTYIAVAAVLTLVAAAACLVPASMATRVEPVSVLRDE